MQPKISDPIRSAICGTEVKRRPDPKKQPNIVFIEPKWGETDHNDETRKGLDVRRARSAADLVQHIFAASRSIGVERENDLHAAPEVL